GQALMEQGQAPRAMPLFERSAQSYPGGDYLATALAGQTQAALKAGKPDKAAAARARLAMAAPASFDAQDLAVALPAAVAQITSAPKRPDPATPKPALRPRPGGEAHTPPEPLPRVHPPIPEPPASSQQGKWGASRSPQTASPPPP